MDEASEISPTEHQRYWLKHIRACEASEKRIAEYATDHGLGVRALFQLPAAALVTIRQV